MEEAVHKSILHRAMLYTILIICFLIICQINLSALPGFYDADMYCDYRYAEEVWEHKSIFPEGWVFGNQLNAVSTPVLAAVIYGLTSDLNFSMGSACIIMAVLVVLSYDWMIKTVLQRIESRLAAIALFITIALYCGDIVQGNQGWTLFFTMCSYYAGYSITAFLAFACYLRSFSGSLKKHRYMLALSCILSFGTGIQSIRQTAIMTMPILALEFLRMVISYRSWKENRAPLWVATGIAVSNVLGLCYVRMRQINQHQVFGSIELTSFADLKWSIKDCFSMIQDLMKSGHLEDFFLHLIICILCFAALFFLIKHVRKTRDFTGLALGFLMAASVLVIVVIDIFTTMYIRPRYYFMLYPLIAFLLACVYDQPGKVIKRWLLAFVVLFFCIGCLHELPWVFWNYRMPEDDSYEISAYLLARDYTTIYANWWNGQDVAVASNGQLKVGYWYTEDRPFEAITHLCALDIYNEDPDKCVYFFTGEKSKDLGVSVAESKGVVMELLRYYPESDVYIYTAPVNLMWMAE